MTIWPATVAAVLVGFALLQNPYWVPGGDSELYVAVARNLLLGNGYMFNGTATQIAPPGWPLLLAALMAVSPTFLLLKLVTMLSMTGALAAYWWILRRFARPATASLVILLTAAISHVYSLTFWLHSDALFTLLTALSLLLAVQYRDGRRAPWRLAVLCLLGAALPVVRWAGLLNTLLLVAALIDLRTPRRTIVVCASVVAVIVASFLGTQRLIHRAAPSPLRYANGADVSAMEAIPGDQASPDAGIGRALGSAQSGLAARLVGFGTWFSFFLFQPLRIGSSWPLLWWAATALGWIIVLFPLATAGLALRQGRWLLPAALLYVAVLGVLWPQANARYLVPIAPLLLLMMLQGAASLRPLRAPIWLRRPARHVLAVGVAATIVCNLALYGVDLWIMRAGDFYARYEAGADQQLIAIAEYLRAQRVGNWQAAVSLEYINMGRRRMSPTGLRALTMLTGEALWRVPAHFAAPPYTVPNDPAFLEWIDARAIRFSIEQAAVSPWRVWHFRLAWLQRLRSGAEPRAGDGWRVYRHVGRAAPTRVDIPPLRVYPTR
ncbi:MAG TPA: hypothetical protein VGC36_13585, partial [Rhizomicrobium sp.]